MASGDTKTESYLRAAAEGTRADLPTDTCCNTKTQNLILGVANRIMDVEDEVEELKNNPDVVDIVDTYADLQAYDTQHLTENDIIRVLQDETHSGNSTYYRFTKNPDTWTFIGEISGGGGVNVVQTTGTSTTDVMSQDATSKLIYSDPSTKKHIAIGNNATYGAYSDRTIAIGNYASAGDEAIAIGSATDPFYRAQASPARSIAIGRQAQINNGQGAIALGAGSSASSAGELNIGTFNPSWGYNASTYRLISGVYDGQNAHDAATKGQLDSIAIQNAGAPTTATVGTVGQLLEDTTNGKLYQCTTVDTTDPQNPSYTWSEVGGGSGPTVVQTTGTSATDVMSQKAVTDTIFADGATASKVRIGNTGSVGTNSVSIGAYNTAVGGSGVAIGNIVHSGSKSCNVAIGYNSGADNVNGFQVVIGGNSSGKAEYDVVIGGGAKVESSSGIALGRDATVDGANCQYSVALGAGSKVSRAGEIGVGGIVGSTWGYNNSQYKIIGGVYDGQLAHDAVTVGQVNSVIDAINTALSTNISHIGA